MAGAPSKPRRQVRLHALMFSSLVADELREQLGRARLICVRAPSPCCGYSPRTRPARHQGRNHRAGVGRRGRHRRVRLGPNASRISARRSETGGGRAHIAQRSAQGLSAGPLRNAGAQLGPARVPDRPSLAVMPFMSIGGEDALGIGIASEIINELARNKDLRLLARDSSFALANQNLTVQEIGEHLRARYLVEGTIQRSDDTLMVDVQLVDALEGTIAWGDRFYRRRGGCCSGAAGDRQQDRRQPAFGHARSGEACRFSAPAPAISTSMS